MNVGSISMVNFGDNNRQAERDKFYGDAADLNSRMGILYEKLDWIESKQEKYAQIITKNQFNMHEMNGGCFNYMSKCSDLSKTTITNMYKRFHPVNVIA